MRVPQWFPDLLTSKLRDTLELSSSQVTQLYSHYELLMRWNRSLNLTAIRSAETIVERHYCESLFFGAYLPDAPDRTSIMDFGSGAGFPGFPMAVLRPEWQLTLLESHQRKSVFLRESTRSVRNIGVANKRAEAIETSFDWIVSRAVAVQDVLAQIPRLSCRMGLLTVEAEISVLVNRPKVEWSKPVPLPWDTRRVCLYGNYV